MEKKFLRAVAMALTMASGAVCADYAGALKHYEAKKFPEAFAEFKRLAELGDAPSQRILAAMYSNGDGVERNLVEAWAWAKLAAGQDEQAGLILPVIEKSLNDADQATAQNRAEVLQRQYGAQALAQNLLPVPADKGPDCEVDTGLLGKEAKAGTRPVKTYPPQYPSEASSAGVAASVCLRFVLDANGQPQLVTPYQTVLSHSANDPTMAKAFQQVSIRALNKWRFATTEQVSILRYCMDYRLEGGDSTPLVTQQRMKQANNLKTAASDGDAVAQFELAELYESAYSLLGRKDVSDLSAAKTVRFLRQQSAINGHASAQLKVGLDLLSGNQCEQDVRKGVVWLTMAAQQGNAEAAYVLAERLRSGDGVAVDLEKSREWLKAAGVAGHAMAKLRLAVRALQEQTAAPPEILANLPVAVAELKDPADMLFLEVRALAAAHAAQFEEAVRMQSMVTRALDSMGFRETPQHQRLQRYQQAQAVPPSEFSELLVAQSSE